MSILDKIVAALTPEETEEERVEARNRAAQSSARAPWLAMVLDHHRQIDAAMAAVGSASSSGERSTRLKDLGALMTAHSIAEEAVIYPALSDVGDAGHATRAYTEQAATKMQMGLLEQLDPMSEEFAAKFEHLENAVKHHVYQEEGEWFLELVEDAPGVDHQMIAQRYSEEFNRYMSGGSGSDASNAMFGSAVNSTARQEEYVTGDKFGSPAPQPFA